jgi:6-phospho-beta-glucosidase
MAQPVKLAVLGGSGVATPGLFQALIEAPDRPAMEIRLVGRSADKLDRVAALSQALARGAPSGPALEVRHTTDLRTGLEGVDYVLNQIRVGGYPARAYDETFPQAFGLPGEETVGPGGMNNALRTIPVVLEQCGIIEEVAPRALLINLTNPSSYIQYAASRYTNVQVIGTCDSPVGLARMIASVLGARVEELWIGYVGMHHFGWVTEVRWHGEDAMPAILDRLDQIPGLPVDADLVRAIGAIPTSYFKYAFHADRMLASQQGKTPRAEQLMAMQDEILSDLGQEGLDQLPDSLIRRGAGWYDRIIVPVLLAHINDTRQVCVVNVRNRTTLPWLPPDAIIEVPTVVTRQGFYPLQPARVPPDLRAMIQSNAAMEMLWVEATVEKSYDKALRAMALNRMVHNLDQARAVLNEFWPA